MPLPCPYGRLLQACPDGVSGLMATPRRIIQVAHIAGYALPEIGRDAEGEIAEKERDQQESQPGR